MDIFAYLEGMAAQHGPSGHEASVAQWLSERFRPLCDSVTIDALYNVIAVKKATLPTPDGSPAPRVMLCAHLDEIALMVSDILPDGTLRMGSVGGVDPRILPASTVTVHATGEGETRKLNGVVGALPPHLMSAEDRTKAYTREELFVDLCMAPEKVKKLVRVGDLITLQGPAVKLLNHRAAAKTVDDRSCVGCLLLAAERLQKMQHMCDIYFVASSQEEVGGRGAAVASYTVDPDLAVVLDVVIGATYGMIAGYLGGKVDFVMQRFVEVLTSIPRCGYVVVRVGEKSGRDNMVVRAMLETASLERYFDLFTPERIEHIARKLEVAREICAKDKSIWTVWQQNITFHSDLISISDNPYLVKHLTNCIEVERRFYAQNHFGLNKGFETKYCPEAHELILEAIRKGDKEQALARLKTDILDT